MNTLSQRLASLSPEQRRLLELRLKQKGLTAPKAQSVIQPRQDQDSLPLSFAQERLWVLHQLQPDVPFYNEVHFFHLQGAVNVAALEQSFNAISQRHAVLRSTFATVEGKPIQSVEPFHPLTLPLIDLSNQPETERETTARSIATQEAQHPFDLANDSLVRIKLLRLSPRHHILLLTVHHIVCDGWSVGVFIRELATFYNAFATGEPILLPDLPIQYADFAAWQREWLQGEVLETQLAYWKKQLSGTLPVLELPTTRLRPSSETGRGAIQTASLSLALTQALKVLSQQEGVTLFMTLLAAFKVLLYRYTRTEDILVGSPIATRNRVELEGLIGLFLNTLVFRTDVSGNPTFQALLQRVRDVALGAYGHQDVPFEKLVEELQPDRNLSQSPLFQVMFILQNTPQPALELSGLAIEPWDIDNGAATFDLTLSLQETPQGLSASWEYNTDRFDAETIERMQGHWQTLLEGIVANPQAHLSELPLLTQAEQQLLINWGNRNQNTDIQNNKLCIHQLFEAQVERTPDAVALVYGNQQLTYAQLNDRANHLAQQLRSTGVQPETLVGICMQTSLEMMVAILAILKAGGAYLPLDPAYPPERLAFMLSDAQVSVLLTQTHLLESLPEHTAKVLCLDDDRSFSSPAPLPSLSANPSNLAYVIYTSGSTDKPKGVMVTHHNLVSAYLVWEQDYELRSTATCHLQMASFSFDVFTGNWVRALSSGAKLVLCPRDFLLMPEQLYKLMRQEQVDSAEFVPAVLRNLVKYLEETGQRLDFMRLLIVGSDSWYVQEHQSIQRLCGKQTRLINSYGVTEATIDSTYFEPTETELAVDKLVPIGRPFPNSQVYVLDADLQPVAIGVPGELYIGGAGVARGYLNRSELTKERFITNPFADAHALSSRLYKTGDLVRFLPDGNLEFLGRTDNQVKLRGFRIELGEIEATLTRHAEVTEAIVLVREDEPGQKRLVAYVVPTQSATPSIADLRSYLKEKLPSHMVPSAFVMLESLPLTPNGKIDRRSLPAPETDRADLDTSYVAPHNPVEAALVAIWAEVLGVEQVGIDDNFFELGGDSILSIQLVAKANQQGLRITPKQVFQHQTIAELAVVVEKVDLQTIVAEQGIVTGTLPLTPIQHWFFEQELLEPHHWNQSVLLEVRQAIDPMLLKQAVQHLLTHHDSLRLRFEYSSEGWQQQIVRPDVEVPFSYVNLSELSETEQSIALEQTATQLQASLNLKEGSILRVALFDLGTHQYSRLLIVIHHLAVDGVSWRVLLEDLQTAYQQLSEQQPVKLPPKTTSFKHWAEQLVQYAQSENLQQEQCFWLSQLQKPIARLPVDFPGGTNTVAQARTVTVMLTPDDTQALLQDVPAAYSTQINDVLLTALVQAFAEWTGKASLLIELEGHGREEIIDNVDISRTVGWFTVVFPVLLELNGTSDRGQALKAVKEQLRQIPNRGIGYGLLRYLNSGETAPSLRNLPQAEVSFNYLGQFDQSFAESSLFGLAKEPSGSCHSLQDSRSHLFEVDGMITDGQLQMVWTYSEALHRRTTVERLAQSFIEKLRSLIRHCQSADAGGYTPSDFPLVQLSQDELDAVFATVEF